MHDNIVYVSTDTGVEDGRMGHGNTDLKIVGYNGKQGGTVQSVAGASDPAYNEYYPSWAPDDSLIAFNRVAAGGNMFIEPSAEVFVVPATPNVTMATRLAANDPVACSGQKSPGVSNSWPKWSPQSTTVGQQDILLADLRLEAWRRGNHQRAALRDRRRQQQRDPRDVSRDLPLEPEHRREQRDPGLGQLHDPVDGAVAHASLDPAPLA